ncbi:hypothetical protein G7Y89_g13973 [Cudoniella acicularis]|uniref:SGNH hydrolase-type esterase domain-containing protein n=1 Tax=Cudoniella acicularis TaxID=354080 RepID=A0A8H4R684_9HELO|nr:hypothetical protein G7Y89_g13973 [Cudoniella acicularis]
MSMLMGPPQLPGYSLRVQLFAPNAHATGDKPIRCFRVVTTPDASIREFCEEARGFMRSTMDREPLAIKKCQDDQEFDVTQSEIVGNLFVNTATIRVIQALTLPGIRDSVPPTSALRYDPSTNRKRAREGSVSLNGSAPSSWKPNKKQRLTELDPDHPLPSRENGVGFGHALPEIPEINLIPNSQESVILGEENERSHTSRYVRDDLQIPETPSPSPPPALTDDFFENHSTNQQSRKSAIPESNANSNLNSEANNSSPLPAAPVRSQSRVTNPPRAKSASYHIQRATERGRSVSTAATSPLSGDHQISAGNELAFGTKRKTSGSSTNSKPNGKESPRLTNEDNIYDNVPSEDETAAETAAILNRKKANLKIRKSSHSGLPGLDFANKRVNTPPNGSRRDSRQRDQPLSSTPGELPLTPNSRQREAKPRLKDHLDEANNARIAAAEAAEQRKRQAKEERVAEEARVAEEERSKRQEQERIDVEEFHRGEAERAAKTARPQKEREERERKEAEEKAERIRLEQERVVREKERLAQEEKIAKEKAEAERLEQERALADEAERVCKAEAERVRLEKAAEEEVKNEAEKAELAKKKSATPAREGSEQRHRSPSTQAAPASTRRLQSSTPFIPTGRKSALKPALASSQALNSSPSVKSKSPESTVVRGESAIPLPKDKSRRISFADGTKTETPIPPPSRILSSKTATPKESIPLPKVSRVLPPGMHSNSPIPVPNVPRSTKERSTVTALAPSKIVPPKKQLPDVIPKKQFPIPVPPTKRSETNTREMSQSAEPPTATSAAAVLSSDGEEEDIPSKADPEKAAKNAARSRSSRSPVSKSIPESESEDDDEIASNRSSMRDSRSPIVFNQHAQQSNPVKSQKVEEPESDSDSEDDDAESADSAQKNDSNDAEEESEEGSDEENTVKAIESSPPLLPPHKRSVKVLGPAASSQVNCKDHTTDDSADTQEEIAQQLTSSMIEARPSVKSSTPIPPPTSSTSRPILKVGASLQSLNAKKPIFASSMASNGRTQQAASQRTLKEASGSEESEEESDDYSSSSDESEDLPSKKPVAASQVESSQTKSRKAADSDSDSSSDSDDDSEDERTRMRNELAAQIESYAIIYSLQQTQEQHAPRLVSFFQQPAAGLACGSVIPANVGIAAAVVRKGLEERQDAGTHWVDTWTSMPQLVEPDNLPPAPYKGSSAIFADATLRQTLHISIAASTIRLQFSNTFGTTDLPITSASLALPLGGKAGSGSIQPTTLRGLTFNGGSESVVIPRGKVVYSDSIDFAVAAQSMLTVSIYLKDGQKGASITGHPGSRTTSWMVAGEKVNETSVAGASVKHWYFVTVVEAWAPAADSALMILGDSITDGRGSTDDTNDRWPDLLLSRMQKSGLTTIGVNNQAAGGNRVLADGLGPSLISRYTRDAITASGAKYVMIFEGVNDLGQSSSPSGTADQLISAFKTICADAHKAG